MCANNFAKFFFILSWCALSLKDSKWVRANNFVVFCFVLFRFEGYDAQYFQCPLTTEEEAAALERLVFEL